MRELFHFRHAAKEKKRYVSISGNMNLPGQCFLSYLQSMGHTVIAVPVDELALLPVHGIEVPQVFLVNISNQDRNDVKTVAILKKMYPQVPILMLWPGDDIAFVINCIKAGTAGFILPTINATDLELALRVVLNGEGYFFDLKKERLQYSDKLDIRDPLRIRAAAALNPRHKNILRWLYSTCSEEEIATELSFSPERLKAMLAYWQIHFN